MFEDRTSESLLNEMLDDVPNDLDKREGSLIHIALSPLSKKLQDAYIWLDRVLELGFASTSEGEYLEKRAAESGVIEKEAIPAVREGLFNVPVEVGNRFFVENVYYFVSEVGDTTKLTCEETGTIGNKPASGSKLLPLDNIDGLETAELGDILIRGEDAESDEELFDRFKDKATKPATSGNVYHYEKWAKDVPGIRNAKAFPRWQGKGTVRVVLVGSDGRAPSPEKVAEVFNYIESQRPFDAVVTVDAAIEVPINVTADVTVQAGVDIQTVEDSYAAEERVMFNELAFETDTVRYSQLSSMILDQPGVIDYQNVLINGQSSNIILASDQIAVQGSVTFNVV